MKSVGAWPKRPRSLMEATIGVGISTRRSEQRKAEDDGEAHFILTTGKAEAEEIRSAC
jgi:hypothetical protein